MEVGGGESVPGQLWGRQKVKGNRVILLVLQQHSRRRREFGSHESVSICDKWHRGREVQSSLEPPVLGDSVEQAKWVDQIF